jgi:hypothetical protein
MIMASWQAMAPRLGDGPDDRLLTVSYADATMLTP